MSTPVSVATGIATKSTSPDVFTAFRESLNSVDVCADTVNANANNSINVRNLISDSISWE